MNSNPILEYKVFRRDDHIPAGWEHIETTYEEYAPENSYQLYENNTYVTKTQYGPACKQPVFLMGRRQNDALEEMEKRINAINERLHECIKKNHEFGTENIKIKEESDAIKVQAQHFKVRYEGASQDYRRAADLNDKYEEDIAKIRNALGELRMNEILGIKK